MGNGWDFVCFDWNIDGIVFGYCFIVNVNGGVIFCVWVIGCSWLWNICIVVCICNCYGIGLIGVYVGKCINDFIGGFCKVGVLFKCVRCLIVWLYGVGNIYNCVVIWYYGVFIGVVGN